MLGPFATASRRTLIHQVSHAARRLRIDVHDNDDDDDNDNAWQRGPLWPHRMGPINRKVQGFVGIPRTSPRLHRSTVSAIKMTRVTGYG